MGGGAEGGGGGDLYQKAFNAANKNIDSGAEEVDRGGRGRGERGQVGIHSSGGGGGGMR